VKRASLILEFPSLDIPTGRAQTRAQATLRLPLARARAAHGRVLRSIRRCNYLGAHLFFCLLFFCLLYSFVCSYLGDLTLAFLNDTGHYYSNISVGGRLVPASADAIAQGAMGSLLGGGGKFDDAVPPPRTPGYLRWGRKEGCNFVQGKADTWSERYVCSENGEYGCTPDNRIAGRCVLELVGMPGGKLPAPIGTERLPNAAGETGLPPILQYSKIIPSAEGAAPTLAGWSDSMDFIPIRVGTINCLDRMPAKLPSDKSTASGGSSISLKKQMSAQLAAGSEVGGQYRCKSCRCIKSSLQSAASFNPSFPKYGLCYMTNCYNSEYLQVGIKSKSSGLQWYVVLTL